MSGGRVCFLCHLIGCDRCSIFKNLRKNCKCHWWKVKYDEREDFGARGMIDNKLVKCPNCKDDSQIDSERVDRCFDCGWMQIVPLDQPVPKREAEDRGFAKGVIAGTGLGFNAAKEKAAGIVEATKYEAPEEDLKPEEKQWNMSAEELAERIRKMEADQ